MSDLTPTDFTSADIINAGIASPAELADDFNDDLEDYTPLTDEQRLAAVSPYKASLTGYPATSWESSSLVNESRLMAQTRRLAALLDFNASDEADSTDGDGPKSESDMLNPRRAARNVGRAGSLIERYIEVEASIALLDGEFSIKGKLDLINKIFRATEKALGYGADSRDVQTALVNGMNRGQARIDSGFSANLTLADD